MGLLPENLETGGRQEPVSAQENEHLQGKWVYGGRIWESLSWVEALVTLA